MALYKKGKTNLNSFMGMSPTQAYKQLGIIREKPEYGGDTEPRIVKPYPGEYNIVYADPPWKYQNSATRAAAINHYPTLSIDELCALPQKPNWPRIANDSVLLMWTTGPFLQDSFRVIDAWGFDYKTIAFGWIKTNKDGTVFIGIGNYFRSNVELCLFGIGKNGNGIPSLKRHVNALIHKRMRHSKKPEIVKNLIVETFGDLPRIELFARGTSLGWSGWGFEA
jgi:site-specific DNA-methyltransferase (adenine-specific)